MMSSLIKYAPYKSDDMAAAYEYGCQMSVKPLTLSKIAYCKHQASVFGQTLIDLDGQMEKISESQDFN